ncbi:MAG: ABC-2 family transporter protein [Patescibacteria group bacterium]|jgi:ABC-2 type transport system permease protein
MKKYFIIFKNSVQTSLAYRFNTFTIFFSESVFLVILLYLWTSIYRQGGHIGSYSLTGLVTYFILSRFVSLIALYDDTAKKMNEEIAEGGAINYFLKPLNYLHKEFAYKLGTVAYRFVVFTSILILALLASGRLSAAAAYNSLPMILFFLIIFFIGICINFLISYSVGLMSFHFDRIQGLNFSIITCISILSGNMVPLDLFPKYLSWLGNLLPFKFIVFIPISIATHRIGATEAPILLLSGLAWLAALYALARILLFFGFKKYEAYG